MAINNDWHIHTKHSCDGACLEMEDLIIEAELLGITNYGISDHLHTSYNIPDIINSRKNYDDILTKQPDLINNFHFGVEVSCVSEWELEKIKKGDYSGKITYGLRTGGPENAAPGIAVDKEFIERFGIEYVIGGVHWPLYCDFDRDSLIKDYHRQYMYLAEHESVDILAHYLWWMDRSEAENPFANINDVPVSMRRELASALKQNNCAFEINIDAVLLNKSISENFKREYLDYIAEIQSMGVTLSIGSDCHHRHYTEIDFYKPLKIIEKAGIDLNKNIYYL